MMLAKEPQLSEPSMVFDLLVLHYETTLLNVCDSSDINHVFHIKIFGIKLRQGHQMVTNTTHTYCCMWTTS